jgi:hypothetical protein
MLVDLRSNWRQSYLEKFRLCFVASTRIINSVAVLLNCNILVPVYQVKLSVNKLSRQQNIKLVQVLSNKVLVSLVCPNINLSSLKMFFAGGRDVFVIVTEFDSG